MPTGLEKRADWQYVPPERRAFPKLHGVTILKIIFFKTEDDCNKQVIQYKLKALKLPAGSVTHF
jgi:hypothetical protein